MMQHQQTFKGNTFVNDTPLKCNGLVLGERQNTLEPGSLHSVESFGSGSIGKDGVQIDLKQPSCALSPVSVTNFFDAAEHLSSLTLDDEFDVCGENDHDYCMGLYKQSDHESIKSTRYYRDKLQSKKRLRFKCDETGEIDEDLSEHSFPDYELTPELIQECWYTKKMRKENKADIPAKCRRLVSPQYRRAILHLSSLATQEDCTDLLEEKVVYQEAAQLITHPSARGFEKFLCSQMMIPRKTAKSFAKEVILLQEMLYDDLDIRTADDIADEIADMYKENAENSVNWALILAFGDALFAREYLEDVAANVAEKFD